MAGVWRSDHVLNGTRAIDQQNRTIFQHVTVVHRWRLVSRRAPKQVSHERTPRSSKLSPSNDGHERRVSVAVAYVTPARTLLGTRERGFCAKGKVGRTQYSPGCHRPMTDRPSSLDVLARQFSRFLAVGVATTAGHYGVLIALVEAWDVHPVWGTTAGFVVAVLFSYLLNRRYTFEERPTFGPGLAKYYASVSMGLVLNAGIMAQLTKCGVHYLLAQAIASGVALIWNFFAARFLVFRR